MLYSVFHRYPCIVFFPSDLQSYPLLVEELEKAIGGGKYGDVISKGLFISFSHSFPNSSLLIEECVPSGCEASYACNVTLTGYSSKVDSLREEIRVNEREVSKLVNRLRLVHCRICV